MTLFRGLFALLLLLQTSLFSQYLYKDELILNQSFTDEIEKIGSELHKKSGISLRLVMLKKLPDKTNMTQYEKKLLTEFNEPTILLTFSEADSKVDILANDPSLYSYFDKKQVLSPVSSPIQAFIVALFYSHNIASFKEIATDYGGTIVPLLAQKAKESEILGKYSGSMFNGYADIAEQIAKNKGFKLDSEVGNTNQNAIFVVKVLFYGIVLYAIFLYLKRRFARRKS